IAIQDVTHNGFSRLSEAWDNLTESAGNYYLNLSDTPFPSNYPLPPKGFTILQGQAARDFLAAEKAKWLAEHGGTQSPDTGEPAPAPAPSPAPAPGTIYGTSGADKLIGTAEADRIEAKGGDDFLFGKGGADQLIGGTGKDKFVFDTALDGSIDQILDFNPADDTFYLDNAIFTKLSGGSLSSPQRIYSGQLVDGAGAVPKDASDYLIYDKTTGNLSYDADGSGAGKAIVFAHLQAGLDLTPSDFYVI
ncbi:MAG: calcium-binding protein, partial [Pseudomonadota bacterium]|nr:calcium-binding protein [Pseudomonadota bacterium]